MLDGRLAIALACAENIRPGDSSNVLPSSLMRYLTRLSLLPRMLAHRANDGGGRSGPWAMEVGAVAMLPTKAAVE